LCYSTWIKLSEIKPIVNKILSGKSRYEALANRVEIPWHFIGITHSLEAGCDFNKHLHNGDPLTARTVQIPKNRPKTGNPPFTWEFSAEDALSDLAGWNDWTVPGCFYKLEGYNGYGYHSKDINSPYLWSFSNHYTKGKFIADKIYSPTAVSKQCGAAILLRRLTETQAAPVEIVDRKH
jgi:lysozyme family protein